MPTKKPAKITVSKGVTVKKTTKIVKKVPTKSSKKACDDYTVVELRGMATKKKIVGRSKLTTKVELCKALGLSTSTKVVKPIKVVKPKTVKPKTVKVVKSKVVKDVSVSKDAEAAQALLLAHLLAKKKGSPSSKGSTPLKSYPSRHLKSIKNDLFDDIITVKVVPGEKWQSVIEQATKRWGKGGVLMNGRFVNPNNTIPEDVVQYANLNFENTSKTPSKLITKKLPATPRKKKPIPKTPKKRIVDDNDSDDYDYDPAILFM
jgi:hypothetical protein